jgi:hypothetical protein
VFQAFFVSYLVEPEYEYKIEIFDDLLESDIIYGYNPGLDILFQSIPYPELSEFNVRKKLRADCNDTVKCFEQMITKGDIATITSPIYASYLASEMGIVDVNKIICSFDETIISSKLIILLRRAIHFWTESMCSYEAVWKLVCWKFVGQNCNIELI